MRFRCVILSLCFSLLFIKHFAVTIQHISFNGHLFNGYWRLAYYICCHLIDILLGLENRRYLLCKVNYLD